jgi:cell division protein FtsL
VLASAFYLVRTQYESRRLTTDYDRARSEALKLDVEHDQLDAERRAQAAPLRVEKIAREQLNMRTITPAITQYLGPAKSASNGVDAGTAKSTPMSSQAATAQEHRP